MALPIYIVLVMVFRHDLHLLMTPPRLLLALFSGVCSTIIFIIAEVCIGMVAFWTTNTRNIFEVYDLLLILTSGELVPLLAIPFVALHTVDGIAVPLYVLISWSRCSWAG